MSEDRIWQFIDDELSIYRHYYDESRAVEQAISAVEKSLHQLQHDPSADAHTQRWVLQVKHDKLQQELIRLDQLRAELRAYIKRLMNVKSLPTKHGYNRVHVPSTNTLNALQSTIDTIIAEC